MPKVTHTSARALYSAYAGRTLAFLVGVCALSAFAYGVFLLMAVAHAAKITAAQDKEAALATEVSELENQYLAASQALTSDEAKALGYVPPMKVSLVYTSLPSTLTLNNQ